MKDAPSATCKTVQPASASVGRQGQKGRQLEPAVQKKKDQQHKRQPDKGNGQKGTTWKDSSLGHSSRSKIAQKRVSGSGQGNHIVFTSDDELMSDDAAVTVPNVRTIGSTSITASTSSEGNARQLCAVPPVQTQSPNFPSARGRGRGRGRGSFAGHSSPSQQSWNSRGGGQFGGSPGAGRGQRGRGGNQRGRGRGRGSLTGGPSDVLTYSNRILDESAELQSLATAATAWSAATRNLPSRSLSSPASTNQHVPSSDAPPLLGVNPSMPGQSSQCSLTPRSGDVSANNSTPLSSSPRAGNAKGSSATETPSSSAAANGTSVAGDSASSAKLPSLTKPVPAAVPSASQSSVLRDYNQFPLLARQPQKDDVIAYKVSAACSILLATYAL